MKAAALALALLALLAGVASAAVLQPLVSGWERYFTLDWQPGTRGGTPVVSGHIFNDGGFTATRIQLLVEGLDAAGNVTSQRVEWLGTMLTPGTTASFELRPAPAATYRVSVFAFDWLQRGGTMTSR